MIPNPFVYPYPLLIITGKGGVGKTVLTATIGTAAATAGHSTLVVEVGGQQQLPRLLSASGEPMVLDEPIDDDHEIGRFGVDLDWVSLSPERLLAGWLSGRNMGLIAQRLESSGALEVIASSIPGIKDVLVLGQLRSWVESGRWDRIIVDGPSSGRAREMLQAPRLLAEAAADGPIASQSRQAHELLIDADRCAALLVTLTDETPVNETIETAFAIEEDPGIVLTGIVINRVFPSNPPPKRTKHPTYPVLVDRWQQLHETRERLDNELPIERTEIPEQAAGVPDHGSIVSLLNDQDVADLDMVAPQHDSSPIAELDELLNNDVIVTVGTGGVGQTSLGAAITVYAAMRGRHVALITIDPARRLADALGLDELNDELRPIPLSNMPEDGSMAACMLDPHETFARVVRANAPTPEQAEQVLQSPLSSQLAESLSGITEYMAVERLWELNQSEDIDLLVVDTPPSADALAFLNAPDLLARLLDNRIYRLLVHDGRKRVVTRALSGLVNQLIRIVGGQVVGDAVSFFRGFDGMEEGFRLRGQEVKALLRSDRTGFALVVSPTENSLRNAETFIGQLHAESIEPQIAIINRCTPEAGKPTGNTSYDLLLDHLRARRIAEQGSINAIDLGLPIRTVDEMGAGIASLADVKTVAMVLGTGST